MTNIIWHLAWPTLNGRSNHKVTVDTFVCLSMINRLTLLFLSFDTVSNFDLWPLNGRLDNEVNVNNCMFVHGQHVGCYFWDLKSFQILTFFDLWLLNCRSDEEVTVDTFRYLFIPNRLRLLLSPFEIISNFDLLCLTFDTLTVDRTNRSLWTLLHVRPRVTCWHCYFCHLKYLIFGVRK